jgi:hypothetical protein
MNNKGSGQYIVMHVLDVWHDADGSPGEHKIPLQGYDTPMSKAKALQALRKVVRQNPREDFCIRQIAKVLPLNHPHSAGD